MELRPAFDQPGGKRGIHIIAVHHVMRVFVKQDGTTVERGHPGSGFAWHERDRSALRGTCRTRRRTGRRPASDIIGHRVEDVDVDSIGALPTGSSGEATQDSRGLVRDRSRSSANVRTRLGGVIRTKRRSARCSPHASRRRPRPTAPSRISATTARSIFPLSPLKIEGCPSTGGYCCGAPASCLISTYQCVSPL